MAKTLKRTYALPAPTLERFELAVAPGQRSAILDAMIRDWLDEKEREQLQREIIAGCHDMAEVYLEIERKYHPLEEEASRALDT